MGLFDQIVTSALGGMLGQGQHQLSRGCSGSFSGRPISAMSAGCCSSCSRAGSARRSPRGSATARNQPVSTDQLRSALGNEQLQQLARQAGLPVDQLLSMLSQHLPQTIDKMSPKGALQEPDAPDSDDDAPAARRRPCRPGGPQGYRTALASTFVTPAEFCALHLTVLERNEARHMMILGVLNAASETELAEVRFWTLGAAGACALLRAERADDPRRS